MGVEGAFVRLGWAESGSSEGLNRQGTDSMKQCDL